MDLDGIFSSCGGPRSLGTPRCPGDPRNEAPKPSLLEVAGVSKLGPFPKHRFGLQLQGPPHQEHTQKPQERPRTCIWGPAGPPKMKVSGGDSWAPSGPQEPRGSCPFWGALGRGDQREFWWVLWGVFWVVVFFWGWCFGGGTSTTCLLRFPKPQPSSNLESSALEVLAGASVRGPFGS